MATEYRILINHNSRGSLPNMATVVTDIYLYMYPFIRLIVAVAVVVVVVVIAEVAMV